MFNSYRKNAAGRVGIDLFTLRDCLVDDSLYISPDDHSEWSISCTEADKLKFINGDENGSRLLCVNVPGSKNIADSEKFTLVFILPNNDRYSITVSRMERKKRLVRSKAIGLM